MSLLRTLLYCSLVYFVGTTDVMDRVFDVVAYLKTNLTMTSLIWIKNSKSIGNSSLNFIFSLTKSLMHTAVWRKVTGKSLRDNVESYG